MRDRLNINLSAGSSCFVRCHGCYNHFGADADALTSGIILEFLEAARSKGADRVTLCGGDPLSRPDILDLIRGIRGLGYRISLDTVGTPLLGNAQTIFYGRHAVGQVDIQMLASLVDEIGIPVDGATEQIIQAFRKGRQNFLSEQLSILSLLNDVNASICVNTVVNQFNIVSLNSILDLLSPFNAVKKWQLFQFIPSGPLGFKNRLKYEISQEAFVVAMESLQIYAESKHNTIKIDYKTSASRRGNYLLIDSDGLAWVPKFSIDNVPSSNRLIIGDIKKQSDFAEIFSVVLAPTTLFKSDSDV